MTPQMLMYTLGHDFVPAGIHAGGLRYHGDSPLVSQLYRTARLANDVSAITSSNPHRIARRAKNKIVGRAIARAGIWRLLWGR